MRAEASPETGLGHVERSLRLAEALGRDGHEATHVVRAGTLGARRLRERGAAVLPFDGAEEEATVLGQAPRLVVYDVGSTTHEQVAAVKKAGAAVVTFDDLGDGRYVADDVVDANLSDRTNPRKMETTTRFHLGPAYAVVDPRLASGRRRKHGPLRHLVVAMGGTDPENIVVKVVHALGPFDVKVDVTLILGPGYGGGKALDEALLEAPRNFDVRDAPPDFFDLLRGADLAIVGGGLTLFEAAAAGTPAVVLAQNKAQLVNAQVLADAGAAVHLGLGRNVPDGEILATVRSLADPEARRRLGEAAAARIDGRGLERVAEICRGALSSCPSSNARPAAGPAPSPSPPPRRVSNSRPRTPACPSPRSPRTPSASPAGSRSC